MAEYMRKMIEEMMAQEALDLDTHTTLKYTNQNVCRSYLEGFCLNELFVNTKLDCGECPKIHSNKLREEYERDKVLGQDVSLIEHDLEQELSQFVGECDRKIQLALRRAFQDQNPVKAQKLILEITHMDAEMEVLSRQAEKMGQDGDLESAMEVMTKLETLKTKRLEKDVEVRQLTMHDSIQRTRVCEVCAAQLASSDEDKRIADHFTGKTHVGFQKLRKLLEDVRSRIQMRKHEIKRPKRQMKPRDRDRFGRKLRSRSRRRSNSRENDEKEEGEL